MKLIFKLFKNILAIFLLPFCAGSVMALYKIVLSSGSVNMIWVATLAGVLVWILIYIFLPEPKWMYVLGHELTHAFWSAGFGGKLKKIKVTGSGGHVLITKANFLTSLAPYFFPFYVVIVIIIFAVGNFFYDWHPYVLYFYFFIGMMYCFHITITARTLKIEQPDIKGEGYIFSAVIIFLGNMCVLLVGIPFLTNQVSIPTAFDWWITYSLQIYHYLGLFV